MSREKIKFECSQEAKQLYLATRKKVVIYGGFTHPGLFSTYNYSRDTTLFYIACILEILGLALIVYYANIDFIYSSIIAFTAFGLDLLFAFWHHSPQARLKETQILQVLERSEVKLETFRRKISFLKRKKIFLTFPLIIMALTKIVIFFSAYYRTDIILLGIVISYIIVALIHIYITGYYLAELRRKLKTKRELTSYIDNKNYEALPRSHVFQDKYSLLLKDYSKYGLERHDHQNYKMYTEGILFDAELQNLVKEQIDETAIYIVSREGLSFQYKKILPFQPKEYS